MTHGATSLKGRTFCEDFVKGKQDTVARFVAWSLTYFERSKDNSIGATCEKNVSGTVCTVNFSADAKGESPWSCGLRFKYRPEKKKIEPSTLECIGTC